MLGLGVLVISIGFDFHFEWAPGLLVCDCESRRTSQVPGACVCVCVRACALSSPVLESQFLPSAQVSSASDLSAACGQYHAGENAR